MILPRIKPLIENLDVKISEVDRKQLFCLHLLELILFSKNNFYNLSDGFAVKTLPASVLSKHLKNEWKKFS